MDTTEFFMSKVASVFTVTKNVKHIFNVEIKHSEIGICMLYGSDDITKATVERFYFNKGVIPTRFTTPEKLAKDSKVWIFTFLMPKSVPSAGSLYQFGVGAGDEGTPAAQIGLTEAVGHANAMPPSLGVLPRMDLYDSIWLSPVLESIVLKSGQTGWIVFGAKKIGNVELDAHVFLVNIENNIAGYWGKAGNKNLEYGKDVAGKYFFICLVNASQPMPGEADQGGYHFHVGDPRKDATVSVSGM